MDSSSRSVTNSIKGRIWLAAGALAIVNCVVGLGAYLTLSFLSAEPLLILFVTFFVLTLLTVGFGSWLASDVLRPLETVTLIARSLERSPSASLPRTTGAIETDQLLVSLHRSGQQLKNLISLMDDVAAGKIEAAAMPLESSDKLSASFQRLVSKVTDSISAKRDLDELRGALAALSNEVGGLRNGKLDLSLRSEHPQTKEIRDAMRFLTTRLAELTRQVLATGSECERTSAEARAALQSALEAIDERAGATTTTTQTDVSNRLDDLLNELGEIAKNITAINEKHEAETNAPAKVSSSAGRLKTGLEETVRSVQKLRSRSVQVAQAARLAGDLSKRSDLVALNASIVSDGSATTELLLKEMTSLSGKAEELHRQTVSAVESLNSEIAGVEKELSSLSVLAPEIGRILGERSRVADSLVREIERVGELEAQIQNEAAETKAENSKLVDSVRKLSDLSLAASMVRETETGIQRMSGLFENLRDSISDLTISSLPNRPTPVQSESLSSAKAGFETLFDIGARNGEN